MCQSKWMMWKTLDLITTYHYLDALKHLALSEEHWLIEVTPLKLHSLVFIVSISMRFIMLNAKALAMWNTR